MKTILMDGTEEGIKKYLECLGINVSEDFEFWGHKHLVNVIANEDKFNQLAQLSGVKQIRDGDDLTFHIRHENNPWTIALENRRKEFLIKYGNNYQII